MLKRILYSMAKAKQHRAELLNFAKQASQHYPAIVDIPMTYFEQNRIEIIALDFDGVLAAHGEPRVNGVVMKWLARLIEKVGVDRICILSNKPTKIRKQFFADHYPGLAFVSGTRKKPYPDGLQKVMKLKGVSADQVCLIDDRLLTGILATIINGSHGILITQPYRNTTGHIFKETFFAFLRFAECLRFGVKR